eukprot:1272464-Amphidinium_carterae.1
MYGRSVDDKARKGGCSAAREHAAGTSRAGFRCFNVNLIHKEGKQRSGRSNSRKHRTCDLKDMLPAYRHERLSFAQGADAIQSMAMDAPVILWKTDPPTPSKNPLIRKIQVVQSVRARP